MTDSKLDGINPKGATHQWVIGDHDLEEKIVELYTEHTNKEIAEMTNTTIAAVMFRVAHLHRDGRLPMKRVTRRSDSQNGVECERDKHAPGDVSRGKGNVN